MIAFAASFPNPIACRRVVMPAFLPHLTTTLLDDWHAAKVASKYQPLSEYELGEVAAALELAEQVRASAERLHHARRQALRAAHVAASARRRRAAPVPIGMHHLLANAMRRLAAWLAAPLI